MNQTFTSFMVPFFPALGFNLTAEQQILFDRLGNAMLEDSFYPSVSKIFAPEEIAVKHFLDSIIPLKFAPEAFKNAKRVVDLGTGGGFPLLPLAIVFPEMRFLGVDSRQKSVEFVARMAEAIGLRNVKVKHSRIEELGQDAEYREKSDLVVCRALSAVRTLLEYTLPLTRNGGYCFYYKGPKLDDELRDAAEALQMLAVAPEQMRFFAVSEPEFPFSRGYLQIHKTKTVAAKYPRKNGMPAAKPL